MPEASFYIPHGDGLFRSTAATTSPWNPADQHGGPPAALLARAIEQCDPDGAKRVTRLTVEFLSTVPQGEVSVQATVVRGGRRVDMVDASLAVDGRDVALARAWRMATRTGSSPAVGIDTAVPPIPPEAEQRYFAGVDPEWGYGRAIDWRFIDGGYDRPGPGRAWARVRLPLVAGEAPTGLQQMVTVADSANGLSAELDLAQWLFVPTSFSLTLHRHLAGEWLLLDTRTRIGTDGVGMTHGELFDTTGPLGVITQPLFVARRS